MWTRACLASCLAGLVLGPCSMWDHLRRCTTKAASPPLPAAPKHPIVVFRRRAPTRHNFNLSPLGGALAFDGGTEREDRVSRACAPG